MPGYPLFNAFSDLAIAGPGKIKVIQKLSKLIIVHYSKLKPVLTVIQENKTRNDVLEHWGNGVSKPKNRNLYRPT
jgi:hypothetical protein